MEGEECETFFRQLLFLGLSARDPHASGAEPSDEDSCYYFNAVSVHFVVELSRILEFQLQRWQYRHVHWSTCLSKLIFPYLSKINNNHLLRH